MNADCQITWLTSSMTGEYVKNASFNKAIKISMNMIKMEMQNLNQITIKLHKEYFSVMRILHVILNSSRDKKFQLWLLVVVICSVLLSIFTSIKSMILVILSINQYFISLIKIINGWKNKSNRAKIYWCIAWEVSQEVPVLL